MRITTVLLSSVVAAALVFSVFMSCGKTESVPQEPIEEEEDSGYCETLFLSLNPEYTRYDTNEGLKLDVSVKNGFGDDTPFAKEYAFAQRAGKFMLDMEDGCASGYFDDEKTIEVFSITKKADNLYTIEFMPTPDIDTLDTYIYFNVKDKVMPFNIFKAYGLKDLPDNWAENSEAD